MTDTAELDRMIIENMLDLDTAAKRIEQVSNLVWEQICREVEDWAKDHGWLEEVADGGSERLAPQDWEVEGEKEAWLYFGAGPDDPGVDTGPWPYFWLTRYIGAGNGQLCLWLNQKVTGARKWKPIARSSAEAIAASGFHLSDNGQFYLPCSLDAGTLANALADYEFSAAMGPIREALSRAAEAKPLFDDLLNKARQA